MIAKLKWHRTVDLVKITDIGWMRAAQADHAGNAPVFPLVLQENIAKGDP
ncbi:unnamed protein product [Leptidea sinapis]|uniref:Uncharacterized protein n=1 Tax=Leptidea sinapis TaxID=189913 RepID=A0A5E4R3F2_9NEOP|nr:unnamed protein product [Leptidea sinapis]